MAQEIRKINGVYMGSQEIASTVLAGDANLQGYWKLEANGNDSSPNGYNLIIKAGTAPTRLPVNNRANIIWTQSLSF